MVCWWELETGGNYGRGEPNLGGGGGGMEELLIAIIFLNACWKFRAFECMLES